MVGDLQLTQLHPEFDRLQASYGDPSLQAIYGAGDTRSPKVMFIFMNPTAKNIGSQAKWQGIRAPWVATRQVWDLFRSLELISAQSFADIKDFRPSDWSPEFAASLYGELAENKVYLTNLAKCTQIDARPLSDKVFKEYLDLMLREIFLIRPQHIVTFGNQVSSIILKKPISVSSYHEAEKEILHVNDIDLYIYPTYYPVGQGRRNMPLALTRIKSIIASQA